MCSTNCRTPTPLSLRCSACTAARSRPTTRCTSRTAACLTATHGPWTWAVNRAASGASGTFRCRRRHARRWPNAKSSTAPSSTRRAKALTSSTPSPGVSLRSTKPPAACWATGAKNWWASPRPWCWPQAPRPACQMARHPRCKRAPRAWKHDTAARTGVCLKCWSAHAPSGCAAAPAWWAPGTTSANASPRRKRWNSRATCCRPSSMRHRCACSGKTSICVTWAATRPLPATPASPALKNCWAWTTLRWPGPSRPNATAQTTAWSWSRACQGWHSTNRRPPPTAGRCGCAPPRWCCATAASRRWVCWACTRTSPRASWPKWRCVSAKRSSAPSSTTRSKASCSSTPRACTSLNSTTPPVRAWVTAAKNLPACVCVTFKPR